MIEVKKGWVITEAAHVVKFIEYILSLLINFHPDDDMLSYVNIETDEPTFSVEDAKYLNDTIGQCFNICGEDVYDICLTLIEQKETPILEKVIDILNLWIIEESIEEGECITKLTLLGFDNDIINYLMDIVNCQSVTEVGVKQIIIDCLDQSCVLDYDIDVFKSELAERLDISYDHNSGYDPYQDV